MVTCILWDAISTCSTYSTLVELLGMFFEIYYSTLVLLKLFILVDKKGKINVFVISILLQILIVFLSRCYLQTGSHIFK